MICGMEFAPPRRSSASVAAVTMQPDLRAGRTWSVAQFGSYRLVSLGYLSPPGSDLWHGNQLLWRWHCPLGFCGLPALAAEP